MEAGIPFNPDFNGKTQEGAGFFQTTTHRGRRASSAYSYLRPAMSRGNLKVETSALAQRILFDGKRAKGVQYKQNGNLRTARARKEVLVSSGAYNSPQLLQLSGVGPAELLKSHGIGVVLDKEGGALKQMLTPFKMFVGGPVGSGRQWLSWMIRGPLPGGVLFISKPRRSTAGLNAVNASL